MLRLRLARKRMNVIRTTRLQDALVLIARVMVWVHVMLSGIALPVNAQIAPALDPSKALTQYQFDRWTEDDGLPQLSVSTILQTRDGFLWLGTQEGLARFDGLTFHIYDKRGSALRRNDITALYEDRSGALWIATRGGGLARLKDGKMQTFTEQDGLPSNRITAIAEDAAGVLWIGTQNAGISRLDGNRFQAPPDTVLRESRISALAADLLGNLWIGTRDIGLLRYRGGRYTVYTTAEGLPSNNISRLYVDRSGALWIGTRAGLGYLRHGKVTTYTTENGLPANSITAIHQDAAGTLWIGTGRTGLTRFRNGRFSTLSAEHGLAGESILALLSDREGSLWIGSSNGGLGRLREGKFTPFTTTEGLGSNTAYVTYEDAEGALWVGTDGGGATRLKDGTARTFTTADGLGSNSVFSIWSTRDGAVWFGTLHGGLSRYYNGRFTTYTTKQGLPDNSIFALYEDAEGVLWIGTNHGLSRYENGRFTTLTKEDGLPDNAITAISSDWKGRLAVGTYSDGLALLEDGRVTARYSTEHGLPSDFVLSFYKDPDSVLWFGLYEGGLARLKDGEVNVVTSKNGLFNDNVFQILEDNRGYLWMSCNQGLFRASKQQLNDFLDGKTDTVQSISYGKSDGLRSKEFNGGTQPAGWKSRDGRLWFPSVAGVVSINPEYIRLNTQPPPVVLQEVLVNGVPVSLDGPLNLPPGRLRLEFHYVGLSFMAPEQVRYQYRLIGADQDWIDAGTRREAFYTNLPPGEYTFEVRAMNNDGVWSTTPASISLYLEPFFWQTAWFYFFSALTLGAATMGAYHLRTRQLTRRQRVLQNLVDERTRELREEMHKTEQARAIIEEQAERLREMDRVRTRFFNNLSHEFRTPLTLNIGPLENVLSGVYGPISSTMRKQVEIMLRNSRRLLRLINQLLDLSKLEAGKMQLHMRSCDLAELAEGVVLSFTAFAEKRSITLHFETNPERLPMVFDPANMEKVLFNLLSNAVKFTPPGGSIRVTLQELPSEKAVELRVKDTGAGIPEMELPYIFDRFHQVDGAVSRVQEGTGLGLALTKELVELHGGRIQAESTVGVGTEFIITLPQGNEPSGESRNAADGLESEEPHVSRGPEVELALFEEEDLFSGDGVSAYPEPTHADGSRELILAVDDNPDIRAFVASCLQIEYRVITAVDGQEALVLAHEYKPDLIVSDVTMPNMNGYDLCRILKEDTTLCHIPVILLTSRTSLEDKIEGFEAGADDYVEKPFNARELLARVQNLLALRAQQNKLKDLNTELQQANEALHTLTEHKSQVLRLVAHDLKNPLNGVRELARTLYEDTVRDEKAREMLGLIQDASDQMLHLVTQLLESEALENGAFVLQREDISLTDLAAEVVRSNQRQASRKEQQIAFTSEREQPCIVNADRDLLKAALDNLVNNAVKYSPAGSPIDVRVREHEDVIRFEVQDKGPGLTEADKERLFRKFQRLSATPTGGESSTGLGLSIVKQIVELHGGRVWAESRAGAGSTFIIELARRQSLTPSEPVLN